MTNLSPKSTPLPFTKSKSIKTVKHLYLIGIGGVAMVWLADWGLAQGWRVSGMDAVETDVTRRLQMEGANIHYGANPEMIPKDITEVIITSAITPSSNGYLELEALLKRGLPITKRAQWTGQITKQKFTIAVCGTHGKTTTTAMIGWILQKAGLDPSVFVGGSLAAWGNKTLIGKSKYLVIEADEFDRSFHQFQAKMAVVLNIDLDHADYYTGGLPEIEHSFHRFLRNLPSHQGVVVGYNLDSRIHKAVKGYQYKFRWFDENHIWPGLHLMIPGKHNLLNATAAARIGHELGIDSSTIQKALSSFPGVGRRFEYLGEWKGTKVYDDYAHHPKEIAATLQGFRERFKQEKITLVFQPHQKARTQTLLKEFGRCFDQNPPNNLVIAPIYQVEGRENDSQISNLDVLNEINKLPHPLMQVFAPKDQFELEKLVNSLRGKSDVLVSMGAGSIRSFFNHWLRDESICS